MADKLYRDLKSLEGVRDELKLQIHLLDEETKQEFEDLNAQYERIHSKVFTVDSTGEIHPSMSNEVQDLYNKLSRGYATVKTKLLRRVA